MIIIFGRHGLFGRELFENKYSRETNDKGTENILHRILILVIQLNNL